jgi:hypothetical protein
MTGMAPTGWAKGVRNGLREPANGCHYAEIVIWQYAIRQDRDDFEA